jgi:hypothetical protein
MKKGTKAWLDFAHRDLESSRLLVDREYVSNVVLFHAQQCVEKCLKALLEENGSWFLISIASSSYILLLQKRLEFHSPLKKMSLISLMQFTLIQGIRVA